MIPRVSMLLKSRESPDMLPFSLCNNKRLAIRHMNRPLFPTTLSIPSGDIAKYIGVRTYQHPLVKCISKYTWLTINILRVFMCECVCVCVSVCVCVCVCVCVWVFVSAPQLSRSRCKSEAKCTRHGKVQKLLIFGNQLNKLALIIAVIWWRHAVSQLRKNVVPIFINKWCHILHVHNLDIQGVRPTNHIHSSILKF